MGGGLYLCKPGENTGLQCSTSFWAFKEHCHLIIKQNWQHGRQMIVQMCVAGSSMLVNKINFKNNNSASSVFCRGQRGPSGTQEMQHLLPTRCLKSTLMLNFRAILSIIGHAIMSAVQKDMNTDCFPPRALSPDLKQLQLNPTRSSSKLSLPTVSLIYVRHSAFSSIILSKWLLNKNGEWYTIIKKAIQPENQEYHNQQQMNLITLQTTSIKITSARNREKYNQVPEDRGNKRENYAPSKENKIL